MTASCYATTATPFHGEVAKPYWQTLVKAAESQGVNSAEIDRVMSGHQESERCLPISVEEYIAAMKYGLNHCEHFGLRIGQSVTPGTYPVLGMTLLSCQSLRQVLEQVVRYESLNHDLGRSQLIPGEVESLYTWTPNPFYLPNSRDTLNFHLVVSVFAGIRTFSPWLINKTIPFKQVCFMAPAPKDISTYRSFFGADIQFDQAVNSISVSSDTLDWPVMNGDSASFEALTAYAEQLLSARECQQDLVWQLKSILPEALRRQAFRIEEVASLLNMSSRTLQRKLKEAGYGYKPLLDEVRKQLAEFYLTEADISMSEIAFLVGYQEQSSFNHAFRSWNGVAPTCYREIKSRSEREKKG